MNQKFEKSQKLEKWFEWMETLHNEIQAYRNINLL